MCAWWSALQDCTPLLWHFKLRWCCMCFATDKSLEMLQNCLITGDKESHLFLLGVVLTTHIYAFIQFIFLFQIKLLFWSVCTKICGMYNILIYINSFPMSISILNIIMIFTEEFPRYLSFVLNLDDNQTSKSNISPHMSHWRS